MCLVCVSVECHCCSGTVCFIQRLAAHIAERFLFCVSFVEAPVQRQQVGQMHQGLKAGLPAVKDN